MKSSKLFIVLSLVVMASMLLSACAQPTAAPTEAPVVPEEPVATEEPAGPPFEGMSLAAPDCEYGGLIKEIAAVDEFTVKFSLCAPDPAFLSKAAFSPFGIQPKEWLESAMESREILEKPIGTGPYMVECLEPWR